MPMEYKIKQVSQQEPKRYEGQYGVTLYYKVRFEGSEDVIEIGRKEDNPPKVGEQLYGTVTSGQYGNKFKSEKKPFNQSSGSKYTRDDSAIQSQWAIGQSVQLAIAGGKPDLETIEAEAKKLFAMIERVKTGQATKEEANQEAIAALIEDKIDEPFNLDDLPPGF